MTKKRVLKTNPEIELPEHFYKKWVGEREIPVRVRLCDNPGCGQRGEFRAPKRRASENQYYMFCLDHVREYNANWDYYAGMSALEIEEAIRFAHTWERPSWPLGTLRKIDKAFKEAWRRQSEAPPEDDTAAKAEEFHAKAEAKGVDPRYKAELNALRELGLMPPVDFEAIKKRYRLLVKRHHPDVAHATPEAAQEAEEKIKRLNAAFTILKTFYAFEEQV